MLPGPGLTNTRLPSRLSQALTSAPVLWFPDFSLPFELHPDGACTAGIGAILCQRDPRNNRTYAVAFASRSLTPAERNYGVSEVEALAIVWGIKKFAPYLASTKFTVVTDHHALQFLTKITSLQIYVVVWLVGHLLYSSMVSLSSTVLVQKILVLMR